MTHSIVYSPCYLLFGRRPKLPIDLIIPSPAADHEQTTHLSYVDKWKEQMTQAYEIANRQSMQSKSKDVERHNAKRLRASILTSRGPCSIAKYVRVGRDREIKVILGRQSSHCVRDLWRKPSVI